ncbi:MAG: hypothetical protein PHR36_01385 [Patescibacteria group bacterium]|nr:hypothetical protein [Patescibacteria group bacterium]
MKNIFKKTLKFISSRLLYLVLGVFLAVGATYVYATWDTARTGGSGQLAESNWNELANMLQSEFLGLNTKVDAIGGGSGGCYISYTGVCSVAGFTQAASLGSFGACQHDASDYQPLTFRPAGVSCPAGQHMSPSGGWVYDWSSLSFGTAVLCCK